MASACVRATDQLRFRLWVKSRGSSSGRAHGVAAAAAAAHA